MPISAQKPGPNSALKASSPGTSSLTRLQRPFSARKALLLEQAEKLAYERDRWVDRHPYYFEEEWRYMRFLLTPGKRVLDLGCGNGHLLNALQPSEGVGVDFSPTKIAQARKAYPRLTFICADIENLNDAPELAGKFDVIVMSDTIGSLDDCLATFQDLQRLCKPETRLIVSYYTRLWDPLLLLYTKLAASHRFVRRNWLSNQDIANILRLADFDVIKREWRMLSPFRLFGLGRLINRFVATLPLIRKLGLRNYVVARPRPLPLDTPLSASIVIPCRNERGNIEAAVRRIPRFCPNIEIIFVEGSSSDGTWEEVQRVTRDYPQHDIKAFQQSGKGKGDAVRKGFAEATRRRAHDPRCRPDDAAGRSAEILRCAVPAARASSSTARASSIRWKPRRCSSLNHARQSPVRATVHAVC